MATIKIPEQKVILCGEYGVGKSSIFRRFTNDTFVTATDRQSTLGLDHFKKIYRVGDRDVNLQLWDTGGMERVASVTSSYYKFAEAAIVVFALDNAASFHALSQHMLDIVTYAENAKIFLCGNKIDVDELSSRMKGGSCNSTSSSGRNLREVSDDDMDEFCEQCQSLISATYKVSCKTGEGLDIMFQEIANVLVDSNRSRLELKALEHHGFKIQPQAEDDADKPCIC